MAFTIRDIAKLAGVSIATVSRVLNGSESVSDETRSRVLAVVSESQFHPNAHAIELVRGRGNQMPQTPREDGQGAGNGSTNAYVPNHRDQEVQSLKRENSKLRELIGDLDKVIEKCQRIIRSNV